MSNPPAGAAPLIGGACLRPATFVNTLHSEWTKLRTLRSTFYALLALFLVVVGLGLVTGGGAAEEYLAWPPARRASFDPVGDVLAVPVIVGQLAIMVLGVLVITSEHATGTIRASLTAVPRRGRLLAAKATTFAAVTLAVGLVTAFAVFFLSQSVLASLGVPYATLGQPHVLRAVVGVALYLTVAGLLALAVGALVRATAGGVFIMVAVAVLLPQLLPMLLPGGAGELLREYWPTMAGLAIFFVDPAAGGQAAWGGFSILCVTVAALLAVAFAVFRARDV